MNELTMERLRAALAWIMTVCAIVGAAFGAVGWWFGDPPSLINASLLGVYCLLLLVLYFLPWPDMVVYVAGTTTMVFATIMTVQQPFLSINLLLSPVLVAILVMPYLHGRALVGSFVVATIDTILIVALGFFLPVSTRLPHAATLLVSFVALVPTVSVMMYLLHLIYTRLRGLKESLEQANAQLAQANAQLRSGLISEFEDWRRGR